MKVICTYIADDGTVFDEELDCLDYEFMKSASHLQDNSIYSIYDTKISPITLNDDCYNLANRVLIPTEEAFIDFIRYAKYCGWCEFYECITSPGDWFRVEDGRFEGHWEKKS